MIEGLIDVLAKCLDATQLHLERDASEETVEEGTIAHNLINRRIDAVLRRYHNYCSLKQGKDIELHPNPNQTPNGH